MLASDGEPWLSRNREWLTVALFAVVMLFTRSWEGDLHGDPVRYAAVAKKILATGDWMTMYDGADLVYANKPPLMFWLVAVNFRLFGASTYAAKFWSCMFALGASVLTCLVGRRLFGRTAGLFAGCMMAAFPGVIPNAIDLRLDSAVVFCAVLAVYGVLRAVEDERPAWILLAGLAGGVGMMTKAAAGLHVVVLTVLVLAVLRPRWLIHPFLLGAAGLAFAIAAPWHVAMLARHGGAFAGRFFGEQMVGRVSQSTPFFRNSLQNVGVLLVRALPWWPLGAWAVARSRRASAGERRGTWVALLWIAEVVLLMALPSKRYDRYTLPAYPAIALLAGWGLSQLLSERRRAAAPGAIRRLSMAWVLLLAALPIPLHKYRCRGFTEARPLLDSLVPGNTIATFDPRFPTGPGNARQQWSLRSKAIYYLDRDLVSYSTPAELDAAGEEFVIANRRLVAALSEAGYQVAMPLDKGYRLLWRRSPREALPK